MKRAMLGAAMAAMLVNSGCTAIREEFRYPGGYPAAELDSRTFNASGSKSLLLLRSTIILAMAARMSRVTVRGEDADAFADYLASATDEINYAAADLYPSKGADGTTLVPCEITAAASSGCGGYYVNFESGVPLIEARIIRVALGALPADRARKFLGEVSKGNVLGAAWRGLGLALNAAGGLHFAAGSYRAGLENVAATTKGCQNAFVQKTAMVSDAVRCLDLPVDRLLLTRPELGRSLSPIGDQAYIASFDALFAIVRTACVGLPYAGEKEALQKSQQTRGKVCDKIKFAPAPRPGMISAPPEPSAPPTPAATP